MYNPLVSEYKLSFIAHRLVQTFFGGLDLRTTPDDPRSLTTDVLKILLYTYPVLIAIVFNLLIQYQVVNRYLSASLCAIVSVVVMNSLHLLAIRHNSVQTYPAPMSAKPSHKLITSLMPLSIFKTKLTLIINSIVAFLLIFLSVSQINTLILSKKITDQLVIAIMVFTMCWFTIINAHFSLTSGPPPETATYSTIQSNDNISSVNRPIHVIIILTVLTTNLELNYFEFLNSFCVMFLSLCPLLWLFGVIPPINALLEWSVEWLNVMAFGGGPSPSIKKSLIHLLISLFTFSITLTVPQIYLSTLSGYILSIELRTENILKQSKVKFLLIYATPLTCIITIDLLVILINADLSFINLWLIITLTVLVVIVSSIKYSQSVYLYFGTLRNPLYPRSMSGMSVFHKFKVKCATLFTLMRLLIYFVMPCVCLIYVNIELKTFFSSPHTTDLNLVMSTLSIVHIHRSIWQKPCFSALVLVISYGVQVFDFDCWPLSPPSLRLTVSFLMNVSINFADKFYLVVILMFTSVAMKKQRFPMVLCLISFDIIIFPFILMMVLISSILSVPILPLFTLPLYFLSFGRPSHFWPNMNKSEAETTDSIYYKQMALDFVQSLGQQCPSMTSCRTGSFLFGRYDDRLILIQILESGFNYAMVQIKGLELQETSCHAVEATAIDQMLEEAFYVTGDTNDGKRLAFNSFFWYAIEPLDTVIVKTFSGMIFFGIDLLIYRFETSLMTDARNVLTGVIDSPELPKIISALFAKVLIWNLLKQRLNDKTGGDLTIDKEFNNNQIKEQNFVDKTFQINQNQSLVKQESLQEVIISPNETIVTSLETKSLDKWSDEEEDILGIEVVRKKSSGEIKELFQIDQPEIKISSQEFIYDKVVREDSSTKMAENKSNDDSFFNNFEPKRSIDNEEAPEGRWAVPSAPTTASSQQIPSLYPKDEWLTSCMEYMYRKPLATELTLLDPSFDQCFSAMLKVVLADDNHVPEHQISSLIDSYKQIILVCYSCLWSSVRPMSAQLIHQIFNEKISDNGFNLQFLEKNQDLRHVVIKSFRYCLKLAIDQFLLGLDVPSDEELIEDLSDFDLNWFIGDETSNEWKESVLKEKRNLFSIGRDSIKEVFTSHLLTLEDKPIHLCRLNRAVIEAIWSSLSLELLYLTNDDDERYSIQANPVVVRNLTVQAADVPIGYPVYVSDPILINFLK